MKFFIDIETCTTWEMADVREEKYSEKYNDQRWLFPEFSRIICVSVWVVDKEWNLKIKSFFNDDEKVLLTELLAVMRDDAVFVWHNITTFDLPFLAKRYIVNGLKVPKAINFYWRKPWEVEMLDTATIWKGMSYKYTSLDVLCKILGVKTPKNWIDWSMVEQVYKDWWLDEIVKYCERDVQATYEVYKILEEKVL